MQITINGNVATVKSTTIKFEDLKRVKEVELKDEHNETIYSASATSEGCAGVVESGVGFGFSTADGFAAFNMNISTNTGAAMEAISTDKGIKAFAKYEAAVAAKIAEEIEARAALLENVTIA